jgi:hypothetical protein
VAASPRESAAPGRKSAPLGAVGVFGVLGACAALALGGAEAPASPALAVEIAGCAAWRAGPRCETDEHTSLVLFVRADGDAAVNVALDGVPLGLAGEPLQGGTRFVVAPKDATSLVVSAQRARALTRYPVELARSP